MKKYSISFMSKLTVVCLVAATAGIIIQILSGASYPKVPPVFFILLIPACLIFFGRWRWAPVASVLGGLFLTLGFFSSGALVRMLDQNNYGVSAGLWLQMLGVWAAIVCGIIATVQNYRIRTQ